MEVILQSKDKYNEIATYNLDTETFTIHSKADVEMQNLSTQGVFSIHENKVACFFRVENNLFFRIDQNTIEFKKNDRVLLEPSTDDIFEFSIERNKEKIFTWKYKRPEIDPPLSAFQFFSPLISEENFDIFQLIHNVINNDERKKRFYRSS
jgi:hypothetical protein